MKEYILHAQLRSNYGWWAVIDKEAADFITNLQKTPSEDIGLVWLVSAKTLDGKPYHSVAIRWNDVLALSIIEKEGTE